MAWRFAGVPQPIDGNTSTNRTLMVLLRTKLAEDISDHHAMGDFGVEPNWFELKQSGSLQTRSRHVGTERQAPAPPLGPY